MEHWAVNDYHWGWGDESLDVIDCSQYKNTEEIGKGKIENWVTEIWITNR